MNKEERKKWLEDHKEMIEKYNSMIDEDFIKVCYGSLDKMTESDLESLRASSAKSLNKMMNSYTIEPTCDEETVCGINIHEYLEAIRNISYHEEMLVLYIKTKCVVDSEIIKGDAGSVQCTEEFYSKLLAKASDLGADIYVCHNHPLYTHAKPSTPDVVNAHTILKPTAEKYGVKVLGYGIVSFNDYCDELKHPSTEVLNEAVARFERLKSLTKKQ